MINIAFLGIASNLGNKEKNIEKAIELLSKKNILILETSSLIHNPPLMKNESDISLKNFFCNIVVKISTTLNPFQLLEILQEVEKVFKKEISNKKLFNARKIDIDILLFNNETIKTDKLIIPHYDLLNRSFFLDLICQIDHTILINHVSLLQKRRKLNGKSPILCGIINITTDSMSDGGKYFNDNIIKKEKLKKDIEEMIKSYVGIIDIGFESTRPNAKLLSSHLDELKLLDEVIEIFHELKIKMKRYYTFPKISIDTYRYETMKYIVEKKLEVDIINDVLSSCDVEKKITLLKNSHHKWILMHSTALPANLEMIKVKDLHSTLKIVEDFYKNHLAVKAIEKSRLIFDIGIGFNKTAEQNLYLLAKIETFFELNVPIFIGHSRKSYIGKIFKIKNAKKRDIVTISQSIKMIENGVEYIRVHNVKSHNDAIISFKILNNDNYLIN